MRIILQKSVPNLGLVGDVVDVADGYYRNYLGPRDLAFLANPKSIKQLEHQKKIVEAKKAKAKAEAIIVQEQMEASSLKLTHSAGKDGKLFGSITNQEITVALRDAGFVVDRRHIEVEPPIKSLGEHSAKVKIHPEVVVTLKIEVIGKMKPVEKDDEEKAPAKKKPAKKADAKSESSPEKKADGEEKPAAKVSKPKKGAAEKSKEKKVAKPPHQKN